MVATKKSDIFCCEKKKLCPTLKSAKTNGSALCGAPNHNNYLGF
jgi:hypothetical protein